MMDANHNAEEIAPTLFYPYWYGKPVRIRPWWLRSEGSGIGVYENPLETAHEMTWIRNWNLLYGRYAGYLPLYSLPGRGWFTDSFPVLAPYFPVPLTHLSHDSWTEPYYSTFWWP